MNTDEEYDDGMEPCEECAGMGWTSAVVEDYAPCHVCGGTGLQFRPEDRQNDGEDAP